MARTTDTYGDLAVTIAILGNLFILGRIMTASFAVTAVTYERFGSLSEAIFALPVRAPAAAPLPRLAEFFSLEVEGTGTPRLRLRRRDVEALRRAPRSSAHRLLGGRRRSPRPRVRSPPSARRSAWSRCPRRPTRRQPSSATVTSSESHENPVSVMTSSASATDTIAVASRCSSTTPRAPAPAAAAPRRRVMARSFPRRKATSARATPMRSPTLTSRSSPSVSEVTISSRAARPPGLAARLGASSTTVRTRTRPTSEGRHHAEEQGDGGPSPVGRQGGADAERHDGEEDEGDDRPAEQGEGVLGARHRGLAVGHVLAAVHDQLAEVVGQVAADGLLELGDLLLGVAVGGELRQVDAGEEAAILEAFEAAAQEREEVHLDVLALHA